ncbi:MAG: hypothetical protein ACUVRS_10050 [Armatimonadota bacterium]
MNKFPRTQVGGLSVPRMIIGTNWFFGYSHCTPEGLVFDEVASILDTNARLGARICMPHTSVTDVLVDRLTRRIRQMDEVCRMIREKTARRYFKGGKGKAWIRRLWVYGADSTHTQLRRYTGLRTRGSGRGEKRHPGASC